MSYKWGFLCGRCGKGYMVKVDKCSYCGSTHIVTSEQRGALDRFVAGGA